MVVAAFKYYSIYLGVGGWFGRKLNLHFIWQKFLRPTSRLITDDKLCKIFGNK